MSEKVTYSIGPYPGETTDLHTWTITDEHGEAAALYADLTTGEICNIEVAPRRRGEGLARLLYETAAAQITIYHQPDHHCTPEGLAFKRAVGGETIPDHLAYTADYEIDYDEEI